MRFARDIFFVFTLIFVSLIPVLSWKNKDDNSYRILLDDREIARGSLEQDTTLTIEVENGIAIVQVIKGRIRISENSCSHGFCMRMGRTDKASKPLICIPNKLVVEVEAHDQMDGLLR